TRWLGQRGAAVVVVLEAVAARGGQWCGGSSRSEWGEHFWGSPKFWPEVVAGGDDDGQRVETEMIVTRWLGQRGAAVVVVLEAVAARGGQWCGGSSRSEWGEHFWGSPKFWPEVVAGGDDDGQRLAGGGEG
nr:hypothetical protein [Tanacetum cinerariifolium]